ncbi:MAG: hypothetical protein HY964_08130 [Ignavibacteriales bacterium]|nr:hypothetical protein [Ignavibacteriales bacterium]
MRYKKYLTIAFYTLSFLLHPISTLCTTKVISFRTVNVDSAMRARIRLSNIRESVELEYNDVNNIHISDSMRLKRSITTTYNHKGDAVSVVTRDYNYQSTYDSAFFIHDSFGNILFAMDYDSLGSLIRKESHTYDHQGKLIQSLYFDSTGDLWYKRIILRDAANRKIQETTWARDWPSHRTTEIFKYDSIGNCVMDSNNSQITLRTYDSDRRLTAATYITGSDTTITFFHYRTDSLRETNTSERDGKLESISHTLFDSLGRKLQSDQSDMIDTTKTLTIWSYDDSGTTVQGKITNPQGLILYRHYTRLNRNNDLLESVDYDKNDSIRTSESKKYDPNGNILFHKRFWVDHCEFGHVHQWHYRTEWSYLLYDK